MNRCSNCRKEVTTYATTGGRVLCLDCEDDRLIATGRYKRCGVCKERVHPVQYSRCLHCVGYRRATVDAGVNKDHAVPDGTNARFTDSKGTRSGHETNEVIDPENKGVPTLNDTIVNSAHPAHEPAR